MKKSKLVKHQSTGELTYNIFCSLTSLTCSLHRHKCFLTCLVLVLQYLQVADTVQPPILLTDQLHLLTA